METIFAIVVGLIVAIAGGLAAYVKGRRDSDADREKRDAKDYQKTMEKMHEADVSHGDVPADREWLRERSKKS